MKRKLFFFLTFILFCGAMPAENHWSFNYHDFQNHTYVTGRAYSGGVLLNSPNIEIAAFTGDVVCGDAFLYELVPSALPGEYFVYMTVYSNSAGQTVTFKAYDHDSGIEYNIYSCETTVVTGDGNAFGSLDNGVLTMNFSYEIPITYGPHYPWTPTTAYGENMSVTAQIQLNGVPVSTSQWEVGAFCGDECRGDAGMYAVPNHSEMGYFTDILIYGQSGDVINFYLYDIDNAAIFQGICSATVTWVQDGDIGDIYDPFILNFVTSQTFSKEIAGYTSGEKDHYYLIASPIGDVNPSNVTHMLENNYDLYYFDQSSNGEEWINYESTAFSLQSGKGYLYANSETVTLTFTGYPYTGDGKVTLTKDDNSVFPGWNLVGNPFAQTAYITKSFYTINSNGNEIIAGTGNSIGNMEGIFVIAETNGETMTFSTTAPTKSNEQLVVNLSCNRGETIDRAIVRFDEASVLPKFMFDENNTKLYIPQSGKDYAIVNSEDHGELPINFKANKNGSYTISFDTENVTMSYLHLIDNKTGNDIDLLVTPSYTFDAKFNDYASRFKLVYTIGNTDDDSFAFFSNGALIIHNDGPAILQVIDVAGHILSSENISGSYSKSVDAAAGVYMLRLINGDNVKIQKIVVE